MSLRGQRLSQTMCVNVQIQLEVRIWTRCTNFELNFPLLLIAVIQLSVFLGLRCWKCLPLCRLTAFTNLMRTSCLISSIVVSKDYFMTWNHLNFSAPQVGPQSQRLLQARLCGKLFIFGLIKCHRKIDEETGAVKVLWKLQRVPLQRLKLKWFRSTACLSSLLNKQKQSGQSREECECFLLGKGPAGALHSSR